MTNTDLLALADRVEKLTGADRVVDALIADAIGWWPEGFNRIDHFGRDRRWNDKALPLPEKIDCPQWTASLDAAMTLKPSEMCWNAGEVGEDDYPWACITDGDSKDYAATGATPALALTAACLRARASTDKGEA